MFKIGEFSKLTQVSIRMLRYYDETGLLTPAKTDPWTGYRMYSAEQIPVLNRIIYLRDSGFQVSEIAAILNNEFSGLTEEELDRKSAEILKRIQEDRGKLRKIEIARKAVKAGSKDEMHCQILMKSIPACQALTLRRTIPDYYAEGELWKELSSFISEHPVQITDCVFSVYHDPDYRERDVDVELCVPVKHAGTNAGQFLYRTIEAVPVMASTMAYGPFSNIAGSYAAFAGWLQQNSRYRMSGPDRQIVHRGPWNEDDPARYLVELQIPLTLT